MTTTRKRKIYIDPYLAGQPVEFNFKQYLRCDINFIADKLNILSFKRPDGWEIRLLRSGRQQQAVMSIYNSKKSFIPGDPKICSIPQPISREEAEMFFKMIGIIKN